MGISGGMQLTNASLMASSKTQENGGTPLETDDTYTFDVDFNTVGETFVFTGDFEFVNGLNELFYNDLPNPGFPGTFSINSSNGTFTYTVTATEVSSSGMLSHQTFVSGGTSEGASDLDLLTFNFTLCFARGTQVLTPQGERAVETLSIGDLVRTADGRDVPVKWIGRTAIHPMFDPADRLDPVVIRKHAFADNSPNRDLVVSADHGFMVDGHMITAGALVNDSTICWLPWKRLGETLDYFHVETDAHDIILANNAPAETFIDYVGRRVFDNHAEYVDLYGDAESTAISELAVPRISAARMVPAAISARLNERVHTRGASAA